MLIHLIGPGGAGKTTTGRALAQALDVPFLDLDEEYLKRQSIDDDIATKGYDYYARVNVTRYVELTTHIKDAVVALSSGFMLYSTDVHPQIAMIHRALLSSPTTVLLLPSFDLDTCVQETTRRQMAKPHVMSTEEAQRQKIRRRFHEYFPMGNIRVSTDKPFDQVVREIASALEAGI